MALRFYGNGQFIFVGEKSMKKIWSFLILAWVCFFNASVQAKLDPRILGINPDQFSSLPKDFWEKDFLEQLASLRYVSDLTFASPHESSTLGLYSMQHFIQFLNSSPLGEEITVTPVFLFDFREPGDTSGLTSAEKAQQFLDGHQIPSYPGIVGHVVEDTILNPKFAANFKGRMPLTVKMVLHLRPEYTGQPSFLGQYIRYLQQKFGQTDPLVYDPIANFKHNSGAYFSDTNYGGRPFVAISLTAFHDLLQAKSWDELLHNIDLHHEEIHWQLSKANWEHRFTPFDGIGQSSDPDALQRLVAAPFKECVPSYVSAQEIAAYWTSLQDTLWELSFLMMAENKDWERIEYVTKSGYHIVIFLLHQLTGVLRLSNYAYHQLVAAEGKVIWHTERQYLVLPVEHRFSGDTQQDSPRKFKWLLNRDLQKDLVPYLAFQQAYLLDLNKKLQEFRQRWEKELATITAMIPAQKTSSPSGHPDKNVSQQCAFFLKKTATEYPLPPIPEFQPGQKYPPPPSLKEIDELLIF